MQSIPAKGKISKIEDLKRESDKEIFKKTSKKQTQRSASQFNNQSNIIYDSGWVPAELENIKEATSRTEGTLLPQKAKYSFSVPLKIDEKLLPFIDFQIIARTHPNQTVKGVEKYVYTGLKEVQMDLFDWQGVTSIASGGSDGGFTDVPFSSPEQHDLGVSLPTIDDLTVPPPEECYEVESVWSTVAVPSLGTGIGPDPLSDDGTIVFPDTVNEVTLTEYFEDLIDLWGASFMNVQFGYASTVSFKHRHVDFPVPNDPDFDFNLPCASEDPDEFSTETYPDQYWEQTATSTFNDLINVHGFTYSEAKDIFDEFYPIIFITPEDDGPPWKAFLEIDINTVEKAAKTVKVTKEGENFTHKIYGHLLLESPANKETEFSDENFKTYEPNGEDLEIKLLSYYKQPIIYNQIKGY